jgi:hypothetical protein
MSDEIDNILGGIEQSDGDYITDIKKYWEIVTGVDSVAKLVAEPLIGLKKRLTKVPDEEWKELLDSINFKAMEGDFLNQFMKHFNHEELKELLKLYEEIPILKKVHASNRQILEETADLNNKWTHRFANSVNTKIVEWQDKGYIELEDM